MHKDGALMDDPFGESRGSFQYKRLLTQLNAIRDRLLTGTGGDQQDDLSSKRNE